MTRTAAAIAAAVTAGVALWISRASFDVAGTTVAPERVAMLPSVAELLGLIVLALLVAAGIASLVRNPQQRDAPFWDAAGDALMPLLGLAMLIVPYLPLIPDWMPALRLLAGPARLIVWIVVIGQVAWSLLPRIGASTSALIFACAAVFLSAPFVMNVRATPAVLVDLLNTLRHLPSASWSAAPAGILGSLFDQEYGIVAYAPVLVLGLVGVGGMLREPSQRRIAVPLTVAILFLIVLPGTVDPWWSKSMLPGRQLLLLLPLFVPAIAWLYSRLAVDSFQRAGAQLLLLVSIAITVILVAFADEVPARQAGDGASTLLHWLSPTWRLSSEIPTYIASSPGAATIRVLVGLALFGIAAMIVSRQRTTSAGRSALAVTIGATGLLITAVTASAALTASSRFDVEGRVMFPLLETFDPVARPLAVRYDAFSVVEPHQLPPLFTVSAVPGGRTDPQPVRVVLNARFRLPAGEYVLDLKGSNSAGQAPPNGTIALQVGREGRPVQAWPLTLPAGGHVQERFQLPLDAEFVGFRASKPVEQNIAELRVTALKVVEARRRFRTSTVLSAAAFEPATLFFHDSNAYAEPDGFWVKGRSAANVTLRKARNSDSGLTLAIHSGARPNAVTLSRAGWSQKLDLVPGTTQRVTIPTKVGEEFVPLTIAAAEGFVPAEIEPSRDRRLLGAWIAFIPDDTSRTSSVP